MKNESFFLSLFLSPSKYSWNQNFDHVLKAVYAKNAKIVCVNYTNLAPYPTLLDDQILQWFWNIFQINYHRGPIVKRVTNKIPKGFVSFNWTFNAAKSTFVVCPQGVSEFFLSNDLFPGSYWRNFSKIRIFSQCWLILKKGGVKLHESYLYALKMNIEARTLCIQVSLQAKNLPRWKNCNRKTTSFVVGWHLSYLFFIFTSGRESGVFCAKN